MAFELDAHGRENYRVIITTTPQLTNWEASFDGGDTWIAGTPDTRTPPTANTWQWLLAGERADPTGAVAVITASFTPHVRAVDNPEVIARRKDVPPIEYDPN